MTDLQELYQQVILDHNHHPRNFGAIQNPDCEAEGYNPLCGDHYKVYCTLDGDKIKEIRFSGEGCAISKSSASIMTEILQGRSKEEVLRILDAFQKMIKGEELKEEDEEILDKAAVLAGVKDYPMRVKCATLAWHTLKAALEAFEKKEKTVPVISTDKE
ncbi:MAG: SUF system NifU family Fe-S cluster assembly protein [Candidatus Hydrogenedentota bacterium]|nr:MAG: SUF system NifU family Fe-S cluster assembly protein [Candidatus Hydrogenedentota bacterium]